MRASFPTCLTAIVTAVCAQNIPAHTIRAVVPTESGQIGINPVSEYETKTTFNSEDPVPTITMTVEARPTVTKLPWAVAAQENGDVVFPVTPAGKEYLQGIFDEVAATCGRSAKRNKRQSGAACAPESALREFQRLGDAGGRLDFDIPIDFTIPSVTAGDVAVALQSVPGAVAIAFLAWLMADNGKVNDQQAVKIEATDIHTSQNPTSTTSESEVATTTYEDQHNSLYTAADNVYVSIAQQILAQISSDWSADEALWGPTPVPLPAPSCDTKLVNMETSIFKQLGVVFCKDIDLGSESKKELTNADAGVDSFEGYKFDLEWEPKQNSKCQNVDCEEIFNRFASLCSYDSHSMRKSGSLELDCGTASYDISPPPKETPSTTSSSTPQITVGPRNCISDPGNIKCWKDVHKDKVEETANEFPKQLYSLDNMNFDAKTSNKTQVLRAGGQSGSGVTYMMTIGWIPECTIATSQKADYPVPGDESVYFKDLLKNNYYQCTDNHGLGGWQDVGCLRYGFYPNNAGVFASPPHPEKFFDKMSYCG